MVAINKADTVQQGFALFMTLVTLVIITISGIAMMRVMEAGTSAAGNIAFRQAAVRVADVAAENARSWLNNAPTLAGPLTGYYANMDTPFNPITFDWDNNSRDVGAPVSGYTVTYVIHRMAMNDGLCSEINTGCTYPAVASSSSIEDGGSHVGGSGSGNITSAVGKVYYRITVKVSGPKHNISYVQFFMY